MRFSTLLQSGLAMAGLLLLADPVRANGELPSAGPFDLSVNAAVTSDYRFRGISLSGRDPALQGGVDLVHDSGLFIGSWASSISDTAGANVEIDLYGGYAGTAGPLEYAATLLYYAYPGGQGIDYWELSGTIDTQIGGGSVGVEVAWVPRQSNFGGDNLYVAARGSLPLGASGAKLFGHIGHEDGDVYDGKWDWEAGLACEFGPLTASLSYVDTDYGGAAGAGRLARAGVVASLSVGF